MNTQIAFLSVELMELRSQAKMKTNHHSLNYVFKRPNDEPLTSLSSRYSLWTYVLQPTHDQTSIIYSNPGTCAIVRLSENARLAAQVTTFCLQQACEMSVTFDFDELFLAEFETCMYPWSRCMISS